jgi:RimJ/RimL family protein N-acetyltransferase
MIDTARLILRAWREADTEPFHAMNIDPEVRRYLGPLQTRDEIEAAIARQVGHLATVGYCFWALERRADGAFLGFCGLKPGPEGTPIAGQVEIGWRLRRDAWGQGYAREAAVASLIWGWEHLDAEEIAAITVLANERSWGLMERIGMTRDPASDFDHPGVGEGDPLRRHITYRIARP